MGVGYRRLCFQRRIILVSSFLLNKNYYIDNIDYKQQQQQQQGSDIFISALYVLYALFPVSLYWEFWCTAELDSVCIVGSVVL